MSDKQLQQDLQASDLSLPWQECWFFGSKILPHITTFFDCGDVSYIAWLLGGVQSGLRFLSEAIRATCAQVKRPLSKSSSRETCHSGHACDVLQVDPIMHILNSPKFSIRVLEFLCAYVCRTLHTNFSGQIFVSDEQVSLHDRFAFCAELLIGPLCFLLVAGGSKHRRHFDRETRYQ